MIPVSSSGTLGLRDRLTKVFAEQPRVPSLIEEISAGPGGHDLWLEQKDQNEAQTRALRVDQVLGVLGWSVVAVGGTANLAVEVSVRPNGSRFKRRLDYFGFDSADRRALLVVETKSPGLDLPVTDQHAYPNSHPMIRLVGAWVAGRQNPRTLLSKDWNDALGQLRDYVEEVHRRGGGLARALLTNGHWWIVILDPLTALAPSPYATPLELIRIYESPDRLLDHAKDLGALLTYSALASGTEPVFIDQIPFCVDPEQILGMSFGVRVMHVVDITSWNREVPRLEVAPVVVLHSQNGAVCWSLAKTRMWLCRGRGPRSCCSTCKSSIVAPTASVVTLRQSWGARSHHPVRSSTSSQTSALNPCPLLCTAGRILPSLMFVASSWRPVSTRTSWSIPRSMRSARATGLTSLMPRIAALCGPLSSPPARKR